MRGAMTPPGLVPALVVLAAEGWAVLVFGQATGVDASQLGYWVMALAAILVIVDRGRSLFFPSKPLAETNVNKSDFDDLKLRFERDHDRLNEFVSRQELASFVARQDERHTLVLGQIGALKVDMETLHRSINNDVQSIVGRLADRFEQYQGAVLEQQSRVLRELTLLHRSVKPTAEPVEDPPALAGPAGGRVGRGKPTV